MGSCNRNRKRLNAYIDDELPERMRSAVEQHLAECAPCRTAMEGLRGLAPLLQALDAPPVPAALTARILAEASWRKRRALEKPIRWRWRAWLPRPRVFTGATTAALVVGLALGTYMGWTRYRDAGSGPGLAMATKNESIEGGWYAFDVLGAEPRGSIEAVTLALLENER
jgi:anti-sigma factor RsiW